MTYLVWRIASLSLVISFAFGCARSRSGPPNLPVPTQSTMVGPGDVFEVSLLGEKDLPKEYRVQPTQDVELQANPGGSPVNIGPSAQAIPPPFAPLHGWQL